MATVEHNETRDAHSFRLECLAFAEAGIDIGLLKPEFRISCATIAGMLVRGSETDSEYRKWILRARSGIVLLNLCRYYFEAGLLAARIKDKQTANEFMQKCEEENRLGCAGKIAGVIASNLELSEEHDAYVQIAQRGICTIQSEEPYDRKIVGLMALDIGDTVKAREMIQVCCEEEKLVSAALIAGRLGDTVFAEKIMNTCLLHNNFWEGGQIGAMIGNSFSTRQALLGIDTSSFEHKRFYKGYLAALFIREMKRRKENL